MQGTPARVVSVSSQGHQLGAIDLADLHYRNRPYSAIGSYGALAMSASAS